MNAALESGSEPDGVPLGLYDQSPVITGKRERKSVVRLEVATPVKEKAELKVGPARQGLRRPAALLHLAGFSR